MDTLSILPSLMTGVQHHSRQEALWPQLAQYAASRAPTVGVDQRSAPELVWPPNLAAAKLMAQGQFAPSTVPQYSWKTLAVMVLKNRWVMPGLSRKVAERHVAIQTWKTHPISSQLEVSHAVSTSC
jgi:hypothetical protein